MSRTVDERAVVMEFDNKQFESGISQSTKSLENFNKSLQLKGATDGIDNISKSLSKIDFMGIQNSIQSIENRFSTFGIIGMTVLQNLTNAATDLVKNGLGKILGQISEGGKRRAMNIESAHFLLQGLLDDEEQVQDVMDRAMKSVEGTAFGFDAAAKAASNFVASGIEAEKLDEYLKATSNLASATGADYQAVSDIMGKIAGQGRILGNELQQFSSMGINAAQYIGEYLTDVNEGKIQIDKALRDEIKQSGLLVKNLKVSQEMVREAISDKDTNILPDVVVEGLNAKLKEIAKRANETFTGAVSNVKAAMSRMGAEFYSPLVAQNSQVVKLINAIRIAFNGLNKGIGPLAKDITNIILGISKYFSFIAQGIGTDNEKSLLATKDLMEGIYNIAQPFLTIMKTIVERTNELFGSNWVNKLNAAIFAFADWAKKGKLLISSSEVFKKKIDNLLLAFKNAVKPIKEFGNRLRDAFYKVFSIEDTGKNLMNFIEILTRFFNSFNGFDPNKGTGMKELVAFFEAVKSIGSSVGSILKTIASALLEVFDIKDTQGIITGITGFISGITTKIADLLTIDSGGLERLKTTFVDLFSGIKDVFNIQGDASGGVMDMIFGLLNSIKESELLYNTLDLLVSIFIAIKNVIKDVVNAIFTLLESLGIMNSDVDGSTSILQKVSDLIKKLSDSIRNFRLPSFDGLIDFFKSIGSSIKNSDFKGIIDDLGSALKGLFSKTPDEGSVDKLKKLLDVIVKGVAILGGLKIGQVARSLLSLQNGSTIINGVFNSLGGLGAKIKSFMKMGNFTDLLKEIGKTLALFAVSLYVISKIPEADIDRSIAYLGLALGSIIAMLELVAKIGGTLSMNAIAGIFILKGVIGKMSTMFIKVAISLWIIAKALKGVEDVNDIIKVFEVLVGSIIALVYIISTQSSKVNIKGLKAFGSILKSLANSVLVVSIAFAIIAIVVNLDKTGTVLKTFEIMLFSLLAVMVVIGLISDKVKPATISKFSLMMIALGAAMLAMSVSLVITAAALVILSKIPVEGLWQRVGSLIAILAALGVAAVVIKKVGLFNAAALLVMAAAIAVIAGALLLFEKISWESVGKAAAMIGILAIALAALSAIGPSAATLIPIATSLLIIAAAALVIASAIAVFALAINLFASAIILLNTAVTTASAGASKIGEFFGNMVVSLTESISKSSETITNFISTFISNLISSFINGFVNMGSSIAVNFANSWQDVMNAITGMGGKDKKTGEKMADATFGDFLDKIKEIFSPENVGKVKDTVVSLVGGILDGIQELLPKIEGILDSLGMYGAMALPKFISNLLSGFGDMFAQFGSALADTDGGWTTTFEVLFGDVIDAVNRLIDAKGPTIIDTILNLLSVLIQKLQTWTEINFPVILDTLFFMLGAAITKLSEWLYTNMPVINDTMLFVLGGVLDTTLTFLGMAFIKLMDWWNDNWPTIAEFLYTTFIDTLKLAAKALIDSTELITKTAVELGFSVIIGFLDGIAEKLPDVADSAINLIETIRDEVVTEENVQRMMDAGAGIILNFLNGMSEWLEDTNNIKQIRDTIGRFGKAIISAIKTFFGFDDNGNVTSGGELDKTTGNWLTGFAQGIQRAWENNPVSKAISWFTKKIKDSTNEGLEEHSPSKFTEQAAKFFTEGFAVGVKKNSKSAINAVYETTDDIKSAFSTMMEALKIVSDEEFDINPTITPVVDTSNIESAAKIASRMFGTVNGGFLTSYGAASALSADFAQNGGVGSGSAFAGNSSIVNFTQNNYSPEALSHYEVYRQTKNLLHTIDSRN